MENKIPKLNGHNVDEYIETLELALSEARECIQGVVSNEIGTDWHIEATRDCKDWLTKWGNE